MTNIVRVWWKMLWWGVINMCFFSFLTHSNRLSLSKRTFKFLFDLLLCAVTSTRFEFMLHSLSVQHMPDKFSATRLEVGQKKWALKMNNQLGITLWSLAFGFYVGLLQQSVCSLTSNNAVKITISNSLCAFITWLMPLNAGSYQHEGLRLRRWL